MNQLAVAARRVANCIANQRRPSVTPASREGEDIEERSAMVGWLAAIPAGPPLDESSCPSLTFADGTLLKGPAPDVYVMENGQKRHAVSAEMFLDCGYVSGNINQIADSTLASIPTGDDLTGPPCP